MKKFISIISISSIILLFTGCETIQNLITMQEQIDSIANEQVNVKKQYSETEDFFNIVSSDAGFSSPEEFAKEIVTTRNTITANLKELEELKKEIKLLSDIELKKLSKERELSLLEFQTIIVGFEAHLEDTNNSYMELLDSTDNMYKTSLRGLEEKMEKDIEAVNLQLRTAIRGLNQHQDEYIVDVDKTIEDLETELKLLIVGRDSILAQVDKKMTILSDSLEEISETIKVE